MKLLKYSLYFILLVSINACSGKKGTSNNGLMASLDRPFTAPDNILLSLDGKKHTLADYRGKPVIVNFWATWCPPCREELPSMNRAWEKIKNEGIAMIAINLAETDDTVTPFLDKHPIDFTVLLDSQGQAAQDWGVQGLPTTFVVSPEGKVVYQVVGGRAWDNDDLLDMVRALKD